MKRMTTITSLTVLALAVSGCAGTDALNLAQESQPAVRTPANTQTGGGSVAAITSNARVQFAPVIGATEESLPALSERLTQRASQRGITITRQSEEASHVVRGYFSAIADGSETTVIYVWDVLDPSGTRLHRIQGQQRAPAGGEPGWASVTPQTMEAVADRTVDELAAWLTRGTG